MIPIGSRTRSAAARVLATANEMSDEGEVRDNGTEDTDEDSQGRAQDLTGASRMVLGSSGVHKDPDNESNINRPSGSDGARGGRSDDHSMPSGRSFGEDGRI